MLCPQCKTETFIDHIEEKEGVTRYVYVCMNQQCQNYRKGFTLSGADMEAQIKEQ